jgi:hypothetical protein
LNDFYAHTRHEHTKLNQYYICTFPLCAVSLIRFKRCCWLVKDEAENTGLRTINVLAKKKVVE